MGFAVGGCIACGLGGAMAAALTTNDKLLILELTIIGVVTGFLSGYLGGYLGFKWDYPAKEKDEFGSAALYSMVVVSVLTLILHSVVLISKYNANILSEITLSIISGLIGCASRGFIDDLRYRWKPRG